MKYFLSTLIILFASIASYSQTKVKLADIGKHVGDSIEVCGVVSGGRFLENSQNSPTLINLGGQYPNQQLTVVIYGQYRSLFPATPETSWVSKEICIKGKVELYKDKPQIIVRKRNK